MEPPGPLDALDRTPRCLRLPASLSSSHRGACLLGPWLGLLSSPARGAAAGAARQTAAHGASEMSAPDGEISEEEFEQVSQLLLFLRSDDVEKRVQGAQNLCRIARALGAGRARDELLPFLAESTDDEEEVLLALAVEAEKLAAFLAQSEGSGAHLLLEPLSSMARIEESAVREAVVRAACAVVSSMDAAAASLHFEPLLQRLAADDWYPSRLATCSLFGPTCAQLPEASRPALLKLFLELCGDDTVMVRRTAAGQLGPYAEALASLGHGALVGELCVPAFKALAGDESDSVRLQTVANAVCFARVMEAGVVAEDVVPQAVSATREAKWRVRWTAAVQLPALAGALDTDLADLHMAPAFLLLLGDAEAEVRAAAVANAAPMCAALSPAVARDTVLPGVLRLAEDASAHVRLSMGTCASTLAPAIGAELCVERLLPVLLLLLRDANPDVRLAVLASLAPLREVIGVELLGESLLPAVLELAGDAKWRVRLAVVEALPDLARQLQGEGKGAAGRFGEELGGIAFSAMDDRVYSVREAAVRLVKELCDVYGPDWANGKALPRIGAMAGSEHHAARLTAVLAMQSLCDEEPQVRESVAPMLLDLAEDRIPNVRLAVARALCELLRQEGAWPALEDLAGKLGGMQEDADADVAFFARRAKAAADGRLSG